jgi:deoxycytidylate deaminase
VSSIQYPYSDRASPEADSWFMQLAREVAQESDDPDKKVGAVLQACDGQVIKASNKSPNGTITKPEHLKRPFKYNFIGHAETRAICLASRCGVCTSGARMYVTWCPCTPCSGSIIDAGVSEVVGACVDLEHERYGQSFTQALDRFEQAGVKVRFTGHSDKWDIHGRCLWSDQKNKKAPSKD